MIFSERLDIYAILLFMSIGQILVNLLFLGLKKKKQGNSGRWFFVSALMILCLSILDSVLIHTRLLSEVPHLLYVGVFFLPLLGPVVYWQVETWRVNRFKWKPVYILHLLPFLILKLRSIPFLIRSSEEKVDIINAFYQIEASDVPLQTGLNLMGLSIQLHPLIYLLFAFVLIKRESEKVETRFTRYHNYYIVSLFIAFTFHLFGRPILAVFGATSNNLYWSVAAVLMYAVVCFITYLIITDKLQPKTLKKQLVVDDRADNTYRRLIEIMSQQRPYLTPEASLNSIAQLINVSPSYLSQVIREFEGKKFLDFISYYRVEAVKSFIVDPVMKNYTLEAIAHESGFANKMSFNRTFKKYCGITPSAYRDSMMKANNM